MYAAPDASASRRPARQACSSARCDRLAWKAPPCARRDTGPSSRWASRSHQNGYLPRSRHLRAPQAAAFFFSRCLPAGCADRRP